MVSTLNPNEILKNNELTKKVFVETKGFKSDGDFNVTQ
jgi:hypothetical protein